MIKSFLDLVVEDLIAKHGREMTNQVVVFPNRRSILFFQKAWLGAFDKSVWLPECVTIQDLFAGFDKKRYIIADDIKLAVELFNVIKMKHSELLGEAVKNQFDEFYPWATTILSDFDDIDKNLSSAYDIFDNMKSLGEIHTDYLSDEEKKTLAEHFGFVFADHEEMLERFVKLCNELYSIYIDFKESLDAKGIAYDGMRSRSVIEGGFDREQDKHYIFVGFNVLNEVERRLFKKLQNWAEFYWDYDILYVAPNYNSEAGIHLKRNIEDFGSAIKDKSAFDNFTKQKSIKYISCATNNAQAKYLSKYLKELHAQGEEDKDTAVVLCDESLLLPVLHSIPDKYDDGEESLINVTMGYPLNLTPAGSLVRELLFYQNYLLLYGKSLSLSVLLRLVRHPYVSKIYPHIGNAVLQMQAEKQFFLKIEELQAKTTVEGETVFGTLLTPVAEGDCNALLDWILGELRKIATNKECVSEPLYIEAVYRAYTVVVRLKDTLAELKDENIGLKMVADLLTQMINSTSVPFHGEADKGLQVMGFLETRGLDFKNVCLLSAGEGILPPRPNFSSFIPQKVRTGFGLTTIALKASIFAYYFYRLLQRADNITILYNNMPQSVGSQDGQMSRFMMQLLVDTSLEIENYHIDTEAPFLADEEVCVKKSLNVIERLKRYEVQGEIAEKQKMLSPSAINTYIDCPLKFYFSSVLHLQKDNMQEDISAAEIGTIFHDSMEQIYKPFEMKNVEKADIERIQKDKKRLQTIVNEKFCKTYFSGKHVDEEEFSGKLFIIRDVIVTFIEKQLSCDLSYAPFTYIASEKDCKMNITLDNGKEICVGGKIDRIDEKDGKRRVVDYKTGGSTVVFDSFDSMFDKEEKKRPHYEFQTILYSSILFNEDKRDVYPVLSFVSSLKKGDESDVQGNVQRKIDKKAENFVLDSVSYKEFTDSLKSNLVEIFDPNVPFVQTNVIDRCRYCDYKNICKR